MYPWLFRSITELAVLIRCLKAVKILNPVTSNLKLRYLLLAVMDLKVKLLLIYPKTRYLSSIRVRVQT